MVGFADTKQLEHRVGFADAEAALRLQSVMGLQTWNSVCALDFVAGLPDVDPTRIGVTGSSGGGTQTFMLCAIDDRPAAALPAVMVSTAMQGGCVCENCSLLRLDTGNVELAALFAPKPLGLSGANDWTREIETKGYPELQALYRLYGAENHVLARCFPQLEHGYSLPCRKLMYEWFNRWLRLGLAEPIEEPAFEPVPPRELSVFDDNHPLPADAVDLDGLRRSLTQVAEKQLAELSPRDATSLAKFQETVGEALAVMVHDRWPLSEKVEAQQTNDVPLAEMPSTKLRKLSLRREGSGEQVPTVLLVPERASGTVVLWLHGDGKASLLERGKLSTACRRLLDRGATIIAPDVFLTGEFEPAPRPPVDQQFAGLTFCYNRTVLANRVHDTLSALDYGLSLPGTKQVHLVGFGRAGVWALVARSLAGNSVARAATDLNRFTFEQVKSTDDDMLLPGALKYGGLPAIAALCAPEKLCLYGTPDGFDAWPTVAYQSAGASERLKLSRGDASDETLIDWLLSDS
jgi:dienelactone hydrolase